MRTGFAFALVLASACAARVLPPAGNTAYGVYSFKEVVSGAVPGVTLEGAVILMPDSVSVSLKDVPCAYSPSNRTAMRSITYRCGQYTLSFDRRNPLRENSYAVPSTRYSTTRICINTQSVNGVDRCVKFGSERNEVRVTLTGKLNFRAT